MPPKCTQLTCDACGRTYERTESYVRKSRARGRTKNYCSNECRYAGSRSQQPLVCDHCGTTFLRYLSEIRKAKAKDCKRIFCSKDCERDYNRSHYVELTCPWCNKEFTVWPSRVKHNTANGQKIYCSAQCRDAANGEAQRSAVQVVCFTCGKPFMRVPALLKEHNFCSRKCMAAKVHIWAGGPRTGFYLPCQTCGNPTYRTPGILHPNSYCSRECAAADSHKFLNHGRGICKVRPDLGHMCRSTWEANTCRVLRALGVSYEYEPVTFRLGDVNYTPDLYVARSYWIEIKGYMRPEDAAKIMAFRSAHPDERLVVVGRKTYAALKQEWADRIPEWEYVAPKPRRRKAA